MDMYQCSLPRLPTATLWNAIHPALLRYSADLAVLGPPLDCPQPDRLYIYQQRIPGKPRAPTARIALIVENWLHGCPSLGELGKQVRANQWLETKGYRRAIETQGRT